MYARFRQAIGDNMADNQEPGVRTTRLPTTEIERIVAYRLGEAASRPWGTWAVLDVGDGFIVKRVTVEPGQRLSLQYHHHRAEDWTIVSGDGVVELDAEPIQVTAGSHIHIPIKSTHRIANTGTVTLTFIEIQRGEILDESDIVRLSDDYGRIEP